VATVLYTGTVCDVQTFARLEGSVLGQRRHLIGLLLAAAALSSRGRGDQRERRG
jgi:hypothetical protein